MAQRKDQTMFKQSDKIFQILGHTTIKVPEVGSYLSGFNLQC